MPVLPEPRGDASALLLEHLVDPVHDVPWLAVDVADPLVDDDLQLALYLCYELHYRGLPGVDERWEWEPSLLALRRAWEKSFEDALCDAVGAPQAPDADMDLALRAIIDADDGPSLSRHLERHGTRDEVLEFVVHRSAYQLKEADPHSWAIPRLWGGPKAALLEVQGDEYGGGRADRIHAELFAVAMQALGLDRTYGAYVDSLPGVTLATVNLMSLLGLHRRWRGAIVGHLAAFEMTSTIPNKHYGNAFRKNGYGQDVTWYFDEHVEADAVHEQLAARELAGNLADDEPHLTEDIFFGAAACLYVDGRAGDHMLEAWSSGRSSLRTPEPRT